MTDATVHLQEKKEAVTAAEAKFESMRRKIGMIVSPLVFLLVLMLPIPGLTVEAHRLAAIMALVILLWVTEALPLPVTALLAPVLAVMLGVAPVRAAFAPMADPLIFLFIGSFILAEALFIHRVNERIAYGVLSWKFVGARPTRILFAYGAIAAVLSAWMSNTATAAMLMPIGLSLLAFMETEGKVPRSYGVALLLMTAYGTGRGGMATPVGTPPNLISVGMLETMVGTRVSFVQWMLFAVPITIVLMAAAFVYLNWVSGVKVKEIPGADKIIEARRQALGPWRRGEINAIAAFGVTIFLWIVPGLLPLVLGQEHPVTQRVLAIVPESVAALIGAVLLFLLPVSATERSTMTWKQAVNIDWGTILLFGGGLALGGLAGSTGLAKALGSAITGLVPTDSLVTLTFASAIFAIVLTETMSNTAAANITIPIVISIALAANVDPVAPAVTAGLAASIASVLPVSTPPNAIVYASGKIPITTMIKYGILMDILAAIIVPAMVLLLV
jgi:sodium-dependent dicarboxylate transporter 2/3/5